MYKGNQGYDMVEDKGSQSIMGEEIVNQIKGSREDQ